jgi:hypothetical protein
MAKSTDDAFLKKKFAAVFASIFARRLPGLCWTSGWKEACIQSPEGEAPATKTLL